MAAVQSNSSVDSSVKGVSCSYPNTQTSGNTNIIVISVNNSSPVQIIQIGDSYGVRHTYTLISGPTTNGSITQWMYSVTI